MQINVVNEIWSYEESINPKVVFPTPLGLQLLLRILVMD